MNKRHMTGDEERACIAIIDCLAQYGVMARRRIDNLVFYGMADEYALDVHLAAMCAEGLIGRGIDEWYKLTDVGREFAKQRCNADVKR